MCIIKRIIRNSHPSLRYRGVHYKLQITVLDGLEGELKEKQILQGVQALFICVQYFIWNCDL